MRRWRLAPGRGVALSVATGLLAVGCAAAGPVTGPAGVTSTAPATPKAQATSKAQATDPGPAATTAQAARPAPTGFWSGSDSWPVPVGGRAPYRMPGIGGAYGGYVGMTGSWSYWLGCHGGFLAWSSANSAQADTNYTKYGQGIGTAVYWFMGGPGVDPGYNGTTGEAAAWGARQAARTLANMAKEHVTYPVVFMDIELPGVAPAFDNGWEDVYSSPCSGQVKHRGMPVALDRADFNGFWSYIGTHSGYKVGVYAAAAIWTQIFGTGSAASIPHTYEWTYEPETASLAEAPTGWCLKSGGCAEFFGGVTRSSPYALMWQWSGGGGVRNAIGDFDQIDASRQA
jgi:hypothetical protein